jgi:RNA polymerase sigma-70 factor (ECF subfamily)
VTVIDELVVRAKSGDVDAFDRLVGQVGDRCFAIALRILRDHHAAEDVVQASLIRAWRDLDSLRDAGRFEPWLHRIVVNACYREARRQRWTSSVGTLSSVDATPSDDGLVSDRDELERGLRSLSPEHRAVLVMHYYLDLGVEDIAERTGVPVGTAKSRLHYGISALRAALEAEARPTTSRQEGIA